MDLDALIAQRFVIALETYGVQHPHIAASVVLLELLEREQAICTFNQNNGLEITDNLVRIMELSSWIQELCKAGKEL